MSEAGDECQEILSNTGLAGVPVLGLGQQGEEGHNLLAKKFGFPSISESYTAMKSVTRQDATITGFVLTFHILLGHSCV